MGVGDDGGAAPEPRREPSPDCRRGRGADDQDPEVVAEAADDHNREHVLVRGQRGLVQGVGH
eukprot:9023869-Alexandrium_andersonii.AAC.1